ncbi:MAG: ribosome silencing factor [Cyclobacteriaceae bacterium]|nr:ribosome silencing factor [Cyclobacteriaceae bacterium SS2]
MRKNKVGETDSETLSDFVVQGMLEKKASDVVVLDLRDIKHAVADYFIICSGSSDTQIDAISNSIEEQVFKLSKEWPWKVEGKQNKEWVLIDYVNVVAHVFNKDKRAFYGLEELWGDAKVSTISA